MDPLLLGSMRSNPLHTADLFVTVSEDAHPLLRVDIYRSPQPECCTFQDVIVWNKRVFVGYGESVYVTDPALRMGWRIFLTGYFGAFYSGPEYLLVTSGESLLRLTHDGRVFWFTRNSVLTVSSSTRWRTGSFAAKANGTLQEAGNPLRCASILVNQYAAAPPWLRRGDSFSLRCYPERFSFSSANPTGGKFSTITLVFCVSTTLCYSQAAHTAHRGRTSRSQANCSQVLADLGIDVSGHSPLQPVRIPPANKCSVSPNSSGFCCPIPAVHKERSIRP